MWDEKHVLEFTVCGQKLSMIQIKAESRLRKIFLKMKESPCADCAILASKWISDPLQIIVAADLAVRANSVGKMVTKTIHTELILNMSPIKNITKSLELFGANSLEENAIFVKIGNFEDVKPLLELTAGHSIPFTPASDDSVMEVYGITSQESSKTPLLDSVISRIAGKCVL